MENRRVEIKNFTNGTVVYRVPSRNVRREFRPNMKMKVTFEELEEGLCDYGVKQLFLLGSLACTNEQDAIDLELIEAPKAESLMTSDDIKAVLTSGDTSKIYLMMKNANSQSKTTIINTIVNNKLYDGSIVKWCKEFFDYNVLPALENTND